jgi:ABC-type uncharacterized transport system auxiliary subunit
MKIIQLLFCCTVLVLSACSITKPTDEVKQWRLMPTRSAEVSATKANFWITQGNISVVSPFDTKSWVFMVDDARFQKDFYNEYISIPGEMITNATRQWLEQSGIFQFVNTNNNNLFANYVLQGNVEELFIDIRKEPKVVIRINYLLTTNLDSNNPVLLRKTYTATELISNRVDSKDILKAQEIALSKILTQLEEDLSVVSNNLTKNPIKKSNPSTMDKKSLK